LFEALWESTEVSDHRLRHLTQPLAVAGGKAYRSAKIIEQLSGEGVQSVIPQTGKKANDQDNPGFDRNLYRRRNVVERLFGWLKESRRVFARSEKTAINYLGMLHVACIRYYPWQFGASFQNRA